MPLSRHSSQAAGDEQDLNRAFLSNFLACSEVDLSDLQNRDNLEDFFLTLSDSSREGTPGPTREGSWNFKKVAAVLAARTAFKRALRGSQPAAAGSGAAGGEAGGDRKIPSHAAQKLSDGLPAASTSEAESDELGLEPLDEVRPHLRSSALLAPVPSSGLPRVRWREAGKVGVKALG